MKTTFKGRSYPRGRAPPLDGLSRSATTGSGSPSRLRQSSMANAVFVAPFLLPATVRFIAAAAYLPDVRLGLISQDPEERLPDDVRSALSGHYRVADGTDAQQIADATRFMASRLGSVDRVLGMLEQLQVPLGEVRDALGIS